MVKYVLGAVVLVCIAVALVILWELVRRPRSDEDWP